LTRPSTAWATPAPRRPRRRAERRSRGARQLREDLLPHERVRFAHNSERQFAKLLDFYGVSWQYEPVEFPLEWTRKGEPASAFRPDFYLDEHELFIEITTLNQKLVTKKNRKVKRLRELYPHVRVKVLYQRDYLNLLVKYGLEQPSQLHAAADDAAAEPPLLWVHGRPPASRGASLPVDADRESLLDVGPDGGWEERRRLAP
jgi:hypothetical protein